MKFRILIVDDDAGICTQLKWALHSEFEVLCAGDRAGALALFREHRPAVTLLDLGLPPLMREAEEGFATLSEMLALDQFAKIIIVTAHSDQRLAIQAIGLGACDFLTKPLHLEELRIIVNRACRVVSLQRDFHQAFPGIFPAAYEGALNSMKADLSASNFRVPAK